MLRPIGWTVLALLAVNAISGIEYKLSYTPKRVAASESAVVDMSVDKYENLTSVELVSLANNMRVSVFKATRDGCKIIGNRFFTLEIVSCSLTHAEIRLTNFALTFATLYVKAIGQNPENSEKTMISLYEPPTGLIVETLHRMPLKLGDKVMLRCHFKGGLHNLGHFSWHRLDSSAPVPGATSDYNYHSEVSWPAKIGDQGEYQCKVVYDPSKVGVFKSAPVQLNIQHPPITSPGKQFPSAVVFPVGARVSFDAHIIANPPVKNYWWEKDGEKLSPESKYESVGICKLHFVVAPNDYGLYSCVAVSAVGKVKVHIQLNHPAADATHDHDQQPNAMNGWMWSTVALIIICVLLMTCIGVIVCKSCRD